MIVARLLRASTPVSPTTAAMAAKAPTGAAHMIIASTRKTRRCRWPMPMRIGSPARPIAWRAKPTSSATSRVWRTSPEVSDESSESGTMPVMKSVVEPCPSAACSWPTPATSSERLRPSPGSSRLPTTMPIASATVDIVRK